MVNLFWMEKMDTQTSELLTRKEACAILRICLTSLDKMRLPSVRFGRRVFYRWSTIQSWIAANEKPESKHL
jgi:hypothetical protein